MARPQLPFSHLQSIGPVYAFLDLDHLGVAWAVMRGMLVSRRFASSAAGYVSFMLASMIWAGDNARLFNEVMP
jgi:hypothetical protein